MQLYTITINNLRRRKAKMFFVLLGLIIGIATMVSVYGVVESMKTEMTKQVTGFGVNVVITPDSGGLAFSYGGITLPEILYDVTQLSIDDVTTLGNMPSRNMIQVVAPKFLGTDMLENGHKVIVVGADIQKEFMVKPWLRINESQTMSQTEGSITQTEVNVPQAEVSAQQTEGNVMQVEESAQQTEGSAQQTEESAVQTEESVPKTEESTQQIEGSATQAEGSVQQTTEGSQGKKMDFEAIDLTRQDIENLKLQDNQVLVGSALASTLGFKEGDRIRLSDREYEIYALLMESGNSQDQQIMMNLGAAQELFNRPDEISIVELAVDYLNGSEEALLSEINEALPNAQVASLRQETLRRDEMLMRVVRFGMTLSVLVLLVGMLVVGLTMSGSVRERTREIGIFRALGFRKSHIASIILMEGVIISILGGIIGFFTGMLMAKFAGPLLAGMNIEVSWRVDLLVIAVLLALVMGVISSLYPAYQATRKEPVEALRFI